MSADTKPGAGGTHGEGFAPKNLRDTIEGMSQDERRHAFNASILVMRATTYAVKRGIFNSQQPIIESEDRRPIRIREIWDRAEGIADMALKVAQEKSEGWIFITE